MISDLIIIDGHNKGFPWIKDERIWFRGYFHFENKTYFNNEALSKIKDEIKNNGFNKMVMKLNGFFSIIINQEDSVLFCTDRLRTLPIFYSISEGKLVISDSAELIKSYVPNLILNIKAINEIKMSSLFVSGKITLIEGIYQVEAGQIVRFDKETCDCDTEFYYKYNHNNISNDASTYSKQNFNEVYFDKVGQDLVESLNGRTAIIPLSGGADSRMILSMLSYHDYENVICFTYGDKNSMETKISNSVAEHFGYEWKFVEYSDDSWNLLKSESIFDDYLKFAGNYVSCPHIQDLYAVYTLKMEGNIPLDSIFIPGHSGDMLAGSHIPSILFHNKTVGQEELIELIRDKHYMYNLTNDENINRITKQIKKNMTLKDRYSSEEAATEFEYFDIIERQAKFVCNSVRVYEYFGFEWRLPLWDNRLLKFWENVPINLRYDRKLYFNCVNDVRIVSTNDATLYKSISSIIRSIPLIRKSLRYITRIIEYYNHPFKWGKIVSLWVYIKYILIAGEKFKINYIVINEYIKNIEDKT